MLFFRQWGEGLMATKTVDRRVKRTKKMLVEGLTVLMKEKSANEISVRELADLVDINRGTFYLHYKDIFDMVEKIQQELFDAFYQRLNKYTPEIIGVDPLPMIEDLFEYVDEYPDLFLVMLGPNGDMAFVERMKLLIKEKCLREWPEVFNLRKAESFEYFYAFIVSGAIGLLHNWLLTGRKESSKEMAQLVSGMVLTGINMLKC